MNHKEVVRRMEAGEKPIDLSIEKWEQILEGTGRDKCGSNCALCQYHNNLHAYTSCFFGDDKCVLYKYESITRGGGGCGGFYHCFTMTYIQKQCMLSFLYAVKEEMIKNGVY